MKEHNIVNVVEVLISQYLTIALLDVTNGVVLIVMKTLHIIHVGKKQ
jgi:hypothetical protein